MEYERFRLRPLLLRPYAVVAAILPIGVSLCRHKLACGIFLFSVSGLLFLSTYWFLQSEIFQCFDRDKDGNYIKYCNKMMLLTKEKEFNGLPCCSFVFQHRKYLLIDKKIVPLTPKTEWSFRELIRSVRHEMIEYYPPNDFKVPNPSFLRLFKEQCLSPLFCFQVFSSLFMCFDDHVWMGIFSTSMVFVVEASLIASRMVTLKTFKTLENKEVVVQTVSQEEFDAFVDTKKDPETKRISSKLLKPGDIVEFSEPMLLPCDFVILYGSCVVSEAMLSGESTPLIKEAVPGDSTLLDVSRHRKHILYGRTDLEKVITPRVYCRVIRTGFETEQGTLLSKMISAEDIKYDVEALRFILILTFIGLINSIFTFWYSKKSGYPLFIDIVVLFTSSIPFELPMEMSVVVNALVKKLCAKQIFCLEPFRINLAGKVDVCCFDKTGTLTDSSLEMKSIEKKSQRADIVLKICNDLIAIDGKVRGDPVDTAIFQWLAKRRGVNFEYKILRRFPFSSERRRQSLIAKVATGGSQGEKTFFAMKGAPEVIRKYLKTVPYDYEEYKEYARSGHRVLAIASRERMPEDVSENNLEFDGFILFGASLKEGAAETCKILKESNHKIVMITGDNLLTAKCVAEQLGIGPPVGVEGDEIEEAVKRDDFERVSIFARADPKHKEMIIKRYNECGYYTMMVGDGTNDVGALKAASVGVAMLDSPSPLEESKDIQPSVKPGDASAAAPFTVRSNSLLSIVEIIQHGRSSLVTTIQMYKILALNSVTGAFSLLFLDILGVKFSEAQMLATGLLSSLCFSAIYSSKPLAFISKERPVTTIFSKYIFVSIFCQSLVHVLADYAVFKYIPHPPITEKFAPSVMNSVLFVGSCMSCIGIFVSNYIGRPFREDLVENRFMVLSILGLGLFGQNVLFGFHSDLNALLEVVDISEYRNTVLILVVVQFVCCHLIEKTAARFFIKEKSSKDRTK